MNMLMDIAQHLQQRGVGVVGGDIFVSHLPDPKPAPERMTVLYDYAGLPQNDLDSEFYQLSLQVTARASKYEDALQLAHEIEAELKDIGNSIKGCPPFIIGNTTYFKVTPLHPPYHLKDDEKGRPVFSQNYRVHAREINKEE